jgi:hypothetical protein
MSLVLKFEHLCYRPSSREEANKIIEAIGVTSPRDLLTLLGMKASKRKWKETLKKKTNSFSFTYETPKGDTHEGELNRIIKRDKEWEEQLLRRKVQHYLEAYVWEAIVAVQAENKKMRRQSKKEDTSKAVTTYPTVAAAD